MPAGRVSSAGGLFFCREVRMTQKSQDVWKAAANFGAPFCLALALLWGMYDIGKPVSLQAIETMRMIEASVNRSEEAIAEIRVAMKQRQSEHDQFASSIRELSNAVKKN